MINEKIDVAKGFQSSVNIAYDLYNDEKIKSFIPTTSSFDILEDVLLSTADNSNDRARILIGAYGRGKSHIILVLMSMLFNKNVKLFGTLLNKLKIYNQKLYDFIMNYLKSDKKLLPVIISGSSASLTQSFLSALQKTLKSDGLGDLMPETNFQASINTIDLWKKEYPDTYDKFVQELSEPIDNYILALREYDVNAYERFEKLYPKLTSGSEFNPFIGFDVVELYEMVTDKLKSKGYDGLYIIYDEFSKYLESSIANASISDIKLLQDFAEKCNRSGSKQMHLMLICHKDIANYIDVNLPKEKVDGWRGVSGRFKQINLHNNFSQMYEIISAVIKKDKVFWKDFCKENEERFNNLKDRFISNGLFEKMDLKTVDFAVKGCYPLHPISTFILPRLSERIAQNERTLFTFLSSDQKFTLSAFLKNEKSNFPVLTPDYIYDYFEPILRKEPYTSEIHKLYKLTSSVLRKVEGNSLEAKIIKTISLIYIVEQFEKLPPIYNIIVDAYQDCDISTKEISKVLTQLIEKECIVYLKRSNNYLKLKESSGTEIFEDINKQIEKSKNTLSLKNIINKSVLDNYMYPTKYNDEMEITRYFEFMFIESSEFWAVDDWKKKIENINGDGIVYAIIPKNRDEISEIKKSILDGNHNHQRIVFIVPNEYLDIEKIAYEYAAVKDLKELVIDDDQLKDEYDIYIEDLGEVVDSFVLSYARPEVGRSEYFYMGKKKRINRKAQISALLSDICVETFPHTPVINNESINKNILPTVAINSRSKIISGLLESELKESLGLTGTGQDVSIMRSTLIKTGILNSEYGITEINLTPQDRNIANMLNTICTFFANATEENKGTFKDLYTILTLPEHGIGLKKGVIPIYIAVAMHHFKNNLVVKYKNSEVKITADLLNSINENPELYTLYLEDWNEEKANYIAELEKIFEEFIIGREKNYNNFTYIVYAMNRWYMSLPKYAKELEYIYCGSDKMDSKKAIPRENKKFINSLKQVDNNARELLLEKIFNIFGIGTFNVTVLDNITATKQAYDKAKDNLVEVLINDMKCIFGAINPKEISLTSTIKDWYEALSINATSHLYSNNESKILELMKSITNDENFFVERLCKVVTSLRIDDWNYATIETFLVNLKKFKETVEEFDKNYEAREINSSNIYKFVTVDRDGNEEVKTFNKVKYSKRAALLFNDITASLDEMGQSITMEEKRQVLMELLEKMC
jgi:hypothetical protein